MPPHFCLRILEVSLPIIANTAFNARDKKIVFMDDAMVEIDSAARGYAFSIRAVFNQWVVIAAHKIKRDTKFFDNVFLIIIGQVAARDHKIDPANFFADLGAMNKGDNGIANG